MIDPFQRRQATTYYTKLQSFIEEKYPVHPEIIYSLIAETNKNEYVGYSPPHICFKDLSDKNVNEILDPGFEDSKLYLDEHTYYICDISENKETKYNSILFSLKEPPKKSVETTDKILTRYFDSKGVPYSMMKKIGKSFGYSHTLPYVIGETCFVPDRGASKNSASWYSLHHISNFECHSKNKEVTLYHKNTPLLTLNISKNNFEKQLSRAAHLYYIQYRLAIDFLQHYNTLKLEIRKKNILHKHIDDNFHRLPKYTVLDLIYYFINYRCQEILTLVLEVDNPYLNDIKEKFKLRKLPS